MNTGQILNRLSNVKPQRGGYQARCPAHKDRSPSLSIKAVEDGKTLLHCHAGCSVEDILSAMGLEAKDLFDDDGPGPIKTDPLFYDYTDETGKLLYQVVRRSPKGFSQRRADGNGGWIDRLGDVQRVPYRLAAVLEAISRDETIYVCEGEKDCDRLETLGLTATTNSGGTGGGGQWKTLSKYFQGAKVVILPDHDDAGRVHAQQVAKPLEGIAAAIKILELPGLSEKGEDVSDWLSKGHDKNDLLELVKTNVIVISPSNAQIITFAKPLSDHPLVTEMRYTHQPLIVSGHINTIYGAAVTVRALRQWH